MTALTLVDMQTAPLLKVDDRVEWEGGMLLTSAAATTHSASAA
jgi:hypothetical protein